MTVSVYQILRPMHVSCSPQGWRASYVLAGLPGLVVAGLLCLLQDPREGERSKKIPKDVLEKVDKPEKRFVFPP